MFPCVFPNGHRQVRKMIRVLLVDDELLSRMTVRSLINWEKEGYTICGECSDGTSLGGDTVPSAADRDYGCEDEPDERG